MVLAPHSQIICPSFEPKKCVGKAPNLDFCGTKIGTAELIIGLKAGKLIVVRFGAGNKFASVTAWSGNKIKVKGEANKTTS